MFYNAHAKSIMVFGIVSYGAAHKTNLAKIDMAQRISGAFFFKRKMDSLMSTHNEFQILTIFETYK